jgi:hypothetical protein
MVHLGDREAGLPDGVERTGSAHRPRAPGAAASQAEGGRAWCGPQRTGGGRRRYTRRQLAFAARIRELLDQGHTLAAARRILALEDDLAAERAPAARLHERLAERDTPDD